jgi:hypothetical protein
MFHNKETTVTIGTLMATISTIVAFARAFRKYESFFRAKGILTNHSQRTAINTILPLWWDIYWRNWFYMFVGWVVVSSIVWGIGALCGPAVDTYLLQHPYIGKHSNAVLWILASIPALKTSLNKWKQKPNPMTPM